MREIRPAISWVGAEDWDRRIFDELIPLPDGTSYNSYLIKGSDKTALIDTVDPTKEDVLIEHLDNLGITDIDYIICNHAEQDHAGTIPRVLAKFSRSKVICTPKCKTMLIDHLHIPPDGISTVEDRQVISLGNKNLEFIYAPWVHWPETMLTYLREDKILFPCDFFGAHLATSELSVTDESQLYESAKRYYAEIMMPFRTNIQKNMERLKEYDIDTICPSHGPIHLRPEFIMNAYREWIADEPLNVVVLAYVSMHGSTRQMVEYLVESLSEKGVTVKRFDLNEADIGKLAMSLVDAATIVLGAPTVVVGPHPKVAYAAFLANVLRPKAKYASIIGSYGWGSKAKEDLLQMLPNLKVELIEPVMCKGMPRQTDLEALEKLATAIAEKHQGLKPLTGPEHTPVK